MTENATESNTATTAEARAYLQESGYDVATRGVLTAEAKQAFLEGTGKTVA